MVQCFSQEILPAGGGTTPGAGKLGAAGAGAAVGLVL